MRQVARQIGIEIEIGKPRLELRRIEPDFEALLSGQRLPCDLDANAVERDVAAFEEREVVDVQLDCPADMPVASGEGYTCDGVTPDGEQVEVWIQIDDRLDGSYTWGGSVPEPVTPASPAPSPGG